MAECVEIRFFHFRHYPVDADDTIFLLCAINGAASHLVSYDRHLLEIDESEAGLEIANRFETDFQRAISAIRRAPRHFPFYQKQRMFRRCLMATFPHIILFREANNQEPRTKNQELVLADFVLWKSAIGFQDQSIPSM